MVAQVLQLFQRAMETEKPTRALDLSLQRLELTVQKVKDRERIDTMKEREQALMIALHTALDCSARPFWLKSADQKRMLYINPAYTREFGITYETYGGHKDNELWHNAVADLFCENDEKVLEAGEEMEFTEWVSAKGDSQLYRVRKWPAVLDGVVLGVAGESLGPVDEGD